MAGPFSSTIFMKRAHHSATHAGRIAADIATRPCSTRPEEPKPAVGREGCTASRPRPARPGAQRAGHGG